MRLENGGKDKISQSRKLGGALPLIRVINFHVKHLYYAH
jgi:hypothetical protein